MNSISIVILLVILIVVAIPLAFTGFVIWAIIRLVKNHKLKAADPKKAAELKHKKQKNEDLPLNIMLFVGSILILIAIGAFIGSIGEEGTLASVIMVSCALYAVGLYLYKTQPRLKPSALAFINIALASVPLWVPSMSYASVSLPTAWVIALFVLAATAFSTTNVLKKPLYSYLGLIGLTGLVVAVANLFHVGAFVACLSAAIFLAFLQFAALLFPKKDEKLYYEPLKNFLTVAPLALMLISAIFSDNYAPYSRRLTCIAGVTAVSYALGFFIEKRDLVSRLLLRLGVHTFILTIAADFIGGITLPFIGVWLATAIAEAAISVYCAKKADDLLVENFTAGLVGVLLLIPLVLANSVDSSLIATLIQSASISLFIVFCALMRHFGRSKIWGYPLVMATFFAPVVFSGTIFDGNAPLAQFPFFFITYAALTFAMIFLSDSSQERRLKNYDYDNTAAFLAVSLGAFATALSAPTKYTYLALIAVGAELLTANYLLRPKRDISTIGYWAFALALLHFASEISGILHLEYAILYILVTAAWMTFGFLMKRKSFSIVGAVCLTLSVLSYLTRYSYLFIAAVGFGLIGVTIYVLSRKKPQ